MKQTISGFVFVLVVCFTHTGFSGTPGRIQTHLEPQSASTYCYALKSAAMWGCLSMFLELNGTLSSDSQQYCSDVAHDAYEDCVDDVTKSTP